MYAQLLELIFFAAIALLVINKLISVLGTTTDDQLEKKKTFFGEVHTIKDITPTPIKKKKDNVVYTHFNKQSTDSKLKEIILEGHEQDVCQGIISAIEKMPSFNIHKFIKNSEVAFKMIIDAAQKQDSEQIEELVDKRYINEFNSLSSSYASCKIGKDIHSKISEIYTFGNSVFVKVLFIVMSKTDNQNLHEEWTFSKNSTDLDPNWYLTNIDKPH